jgi:hypothetical protein
MEEILKEVVKKDIKESVNKEISKYEKIFKDNATFLTKDIGMRLAEKYLTLKIEKALKDSKFIETYKGFKVSVSEITNMRSFADVRIVIYFYRNNYEDYSFSNYSTSIHINFRELFSNCSSVVLSNFESYNFNYTSNSAGETKEKTQKYINNLLNIFVELAKLAGYSTVLYTASMSENDKYLLKYLEDNWECIKEFTNKRNNNKIKYYTKDL